jgi:serine/threonine protein kinase
MHFKRLARAVCYPEQTVECLDDNAASEFVSGALAASAITRVEQHLASCRDCRALVAALAGDEADSNAATHKHEKVSEDSQVAKRPVLSVGDRVGRYLVLSSIGAGGMGVVFAAYDPQLDRKVALKLLRANLGANTNEARTRLKREAQAIAQLNHPNVVGVYDVGTTDVGDVYIAMEFVEGDTLTTWLKRWPRTWREILDVFAQAARGLMAAHSVGLLHRDFKPDNVLVGTDGRVRVTDFGLARSVFLDDSARGAATTQNIFDGRTPQQTPAAGSPLQVDLTATGTVLGTPRYMPPEQLTGPSIDARADQFSFCVALYEALYGTHPLPGATSVSMLEHDERALPPPQTVKVPASISRAVMRGLEKERSKRFATLAALMHELTPPPQRSSVRFVALAAVGALAVTGATAAIMSRPGEPARLPVENDDPSRKLLLDELARKDQEIEDLKNRLLNERAKDQKEIEILTKQLEAKQAEVNELIDKIARTRVAGRIPDVKTPTHVESKQITAALQQVHRDVQGCFDEWAERAHLEQPRGAGVPMSRDAGVVVRIAVTPDGLGHDAAAKGHDSPSLRLCIEQTMARVGFPKGPEALELQIQIAWAGGNLDMTGNILGRSTSQGGSLDM